MPDSNARYLGAWGEISARLQTRDRVLLSFITLTAVLIGLSLSRIELSISAVAVGYIALATALLNRHNDIIITQLAKYQRSLVADDSANKDLPDWHARDHRGRSLLARSTRDIAQILFIVFGAVPSIYIAGKDLSGPFDFTTVLWYGSILCSFYAIYVVIRTRVQRIRMAESK